MTNSARVIFYISIYIERIYSEKSDKPKEYIGHHDPFALLSSHTLVLLRKKLIRAIQLPYTRYTHTCLYEMRGRICVH